MDRYRVKIKVFGVDVTLLVYDESIEAALSRVKEMSVLEVLGSYKVKHVAESFCISKVQIEKED